MRGPSTAAAPGSAAASFPKPFSGHKARDPRLSDSDEWLTWGERFFVPIAFEQQVTEESGDFPPALQSEEEIFEKLAARLGLREARERLAREQ